MPVGRWWRLRWLQLQAQAWLLCGRPASALRCFDAILVLVPADRHALASRAHLLAQAGDAAGAVAALQALTAHHAHDACSWFNLAYLLQAMERDGEAETAFTRALAIDDTLDRAWYGLALLHIRARRFDDAVVALRRNTRLQPMSPSGWYQLARVQCDRQRPDEAAWIIRHLKGFEPRVAAQLERETGLHVQLSS